MAISPALGAQLAEPVADIYRDAELRIIARIAASLKAGITLSDWDQRQLGRVAAIRAEVLRILATTNAQAAAAIQTAIDSAYTRGGADVLRETAGLVKPVRLATDARYLATAALAADASRVIQAAAPAILRRVDDVYRSVVAQASAEVLTGASRIDATQRALDGFLAQGITTVNAGRGTMSVADYTTMAVRTASARSAIQGQTAQMSALDLDLVVVHPGPRACDICDTWARSILSVSGSGGSMYVTDLKTGEQIEVQVDGSLDDARDDGWGHPNCRCALQVYLPGVTDASIIDRPPWDQEGYEAQQRQRGIERQIRAWKGREAGALTDEAAAEAKGYVQSWQGAMREHIAENPDLKRQSEREQITGTLGPR